MNHPLYKINQNTQDLIDRYDLFDWQKVVQMPLGNVDINSNKITLGNKEVISFGNSSYLGLHKDTRAIEAGVEAMRSQGLLYSSSRAFTYMPKHDEFEDLLGQIFGSPTVATIQTAMADYGIMPLLMMPNQVALVDSMAHATLQTMIMIPKSMGLKVDRVKHNDLEHLESKIQFYLKQGVEKIWYVADSIYSMYGDTSPVKDIIYLLDKYENFFMFYDDAHGMSWAGPNGAGYVAKYLPLGHEKVVMVTSLGKGFGLGGGALICPNKEMKTWIRRTGTNVVFCTQLSNQMLASGIELAKIHLSNEIYFLQDKLKSNIEYFIEKAILLKLPFLNYNETPIFYMLIGDHSLAIEFNQKLTANGFYGNLGIYPAVAHKNSGLRLSITSEHSHSEINDLLDVVDFCLQEVLKEKNITIEYFKGSFENVLLRA
jgi:7-keto-8-aminopelargonate synthetase-like enzyme